MSLPVLSPFDPGAVSFSEAWFLAHTFRSNYFYISVHVLADTQGKKNNKKEQMSWFLKESLWQGIRCGLPSLLCTHSDPIAIDILHFPQWGWLRQGHGTGTMLCHSLLTQSVLAQSRQGTSHLQVSQIKTGLLLAACSILNVCQGWLLVICLPVWDDSLMTFEQQLWPWLVARDTKTCVHDITWWTARCIWRHENSAAY